MEFTITSTSGDIKPRKVLINTLEELIQIVSLCPSNRIVIEKYSQDEIPNIEIYDDNREECMNCACR